MVENKEFFVYSVGANCVRPLGHVVNRAGEHSSPLQITIIKFALNYCESSGRPMVAPTKRICIFQINELQKITDIRSSAEWQNMAEISIIKKI